MDEPNELGRVAKLVSMEGTFFKSSRKILVLSLVKLTVSLIKLIRNTIIIITREGGSNLRRGGSTCSPSKANVSGGARKADAGRTVGHRKFRLQFLNSH